MMSHRVVAGGAPLVVSVPHAGTGLDEAARAALNSDGRKLPDTDWFVDRLVDGLGALGATLIVATQSRMVVDLNRPENNSPLYPGQEGTGLIPETLFDGSPARVRPVTEAERSRRLEEIWRPYHREIQSALERVRSQHGHAILWDVHSIRGRVPRLFSGRLPDLNLGTNGGLSCGARVAEVAEKTLAASPYTYVVDGRFKGGHITRAYGRPEQNIHAIQLEMALHCYLDERVSPPCWDAARAASLKRVLSGLGQALIACDP